MKNKYIMITVVVIIIGIAVFWGGMKYQENKSAGSNSSRQFLGGAGRQGGQNNQGRFGAGGRPVAGEILNLDEKSITVKLTDGSSKIVLLSDKTTINKASEASKTDLKAGTRVAAFGTENSDGSITATNIQLNPQLGRMGDSRQPNQDKKSSDAKEIVVEGSNYKFAPYKLTVKKGVKTRILFKNKEGVHDFRVDELNIQTAVIREGEEDFIEFTPEKSGTYEFYCSVGNHRAMGMKGTLTVE